MALLDGGLHAHIGRGQCQDLAAQTLHQAEALAGVLAQVAQRVAERVRLSGCRSHGAAGALNDGGDLERLTTCFKRGGVGVALCCGGPVCAALDRIVGASPCPEASGGRSSRAADRSALFGHGGSERAGPALCPSNGLGQLRGRPCCGCSLMTEATQFVLRLDPLTVQGLQVQKLGVLVVRAVAALDALDDGSRDRAKPFHAATHLGQLGCGAGGRTGHGVLRGGQPTEAFARLTRSGIQGAHLGAGAGHIRAHGEDGVTSPMRLDSEFLLGAGGGSGVAFQSLDLGLRLLHRGRQTVDRRFQATALGVGCGDLLVDDGLEGCAGRGCWRPGFDPDTSGCDVAASARAARGVQRLQVLLGLADGLVVLLLGGRLDVKLTRLITIGALAGADRLVQIAGGVGGLESFSLDGIEALCAALQVGLQTGHGAANPRQIVGHLVEATQGRGASFEAREVGGQAGKRGPRLGCS